MPKNEVSKWGIVGLVSLGVSLWGYYKYHNNKLSRRVTDPNEKFLRSNILTTVNEAIVPWFGVIARLKDKYPTSTLVYKTKNISLHFLEFQIIDIFQRTHNVKQFRFKLDEDEALQIPLGTHVQVQSESGAKRPYTPITSLNQKGYFDLLIKEYPGGKVSTFMHSRKVGDKVLISGPVGGGKLQHIQWDQVKAIGMIAAGTGITPIYQLLKSLSEEARFADLKIDLLYSVATERDLLLREELQEVKQQLKDLNIRYTYTQEQEKQRINGEMISNAFGISSMEERLGSLDYVFICGSKAFSTKMEELLLTLGFFENQIIIF